MDDSDWITDLRSCITSVKGGIPLNQIENELFKLTRIRIPYKNLGFSTLEDCLKSSGDFSIQNRDGVSIVHVVTSSKTQHLTELINKQKSKPPKKALTPWKYNTSSSYYKPNHYSRPGKSSSQNGLLQSPVTHFKNHESSSSSDNSRSNQHNDYLSERYEQNNDNKPIKPSTIQNRLNKFKKPSDGALNIVADKVIDDNDDIKELETFVKSLNLSEPCYEFMETKEKSGKTMKRSHMCMIKINNESVSSSFPVECSSQDYAKKVAAKNTLNALKKQYGESIIYPVTNDINKMASRIKEILKQGFQETGLICDDLERMYRKQFQENFPDNWIQLLEVFSYFMFDKLVSNKIIIYLNEVENNDIKGRTNSNGCIDNAPVEQDIIPGTSVTFEDFNEKSVLVSANYGSANIWIHFVGQDADENFLQMQEKFNHMMNTSGFSIAEQITEGEFYAVLYNSSWHRVQIFNTIDEDGTVTCFMIDTGEQLNIARDQICRLDPVFMKTKIQAIQCILTQLDYFYAFYGLKELLDEMILNKTFLLIPDTLEEGQIPRVTLYEKSEVSDKMNVNDLIIKKFLEKTIPRLPSFEENAIVDATVSSVVESGHLNLQLNPEIVSSLEEILPNEEFLSPDYFVMNKEEVKKDSVYLTKYENENMWCRVQVVEFKDDSKVQIMYIDYGNFAECEITKLAKLDLYDPLMSKISPQALKVSLHLLPPSTMTPAIADKIFEILGGESKVLVNVINLPTNDVPLVNLFKNLPDTPDTPLCINIQIAQR